MVLRLVPYWRKPKQRKPKPQGLQLTVARSGPAGVVWKTYDTTQRIKYERSAKPRVDNPPAIPVLEDPPSPSHSLFPPRELDATRDKQDNQPALSTPSPAGHSTTTNTNTMGNDGGSIPTRRELVKEAARNPTHSQIRDTQAQTRQYRWSTCQLSKRPLATPVVSDSLGRLYNKDAIIEWLLRGTEAYGDGEEVLQGRVKSLKDVVEVKFEVLREEGKDAESGREERWVCPVSRKELGQGVKAVYIVPCGHVLAESAVKEVGSTENGCLVCTKPYDEIDVIPINPEEQKDIERLQERIKTHAANSLTHALKKLAEKKSKKRKNGATEGDEGSTKAKKPKESGIRNAAAAVLTAKVLQDQEIKNQQRKSGMSDSVKSLFTKQGDEKLEGRNTDFMSRGYTLPDAQK